MFFRQRAAGHATLSYLFGCVGIGKAMAVDVVAGDEDEFITTIGFEKRFNPLLALPRDAFIEALIAGMPPKQPGMDDVVAANLRGLLPAREAA
jgi:hypothetical protein